MADPASHDASEQRSGTTSDSEVATSDNSDAVAPVVTVRENFELGPSDLITDSALRNIEGDQFAHHEIAERVAELAVHAELPVNIALFGPWGSGKTSLYNLIEMSLDAKAADRPELPTIRTIRYDAWKFGGESLKRNFVAQAADELQVSKEDYRQTLYENVSFIRIPFRAFWTSNWKQTALTFLTIIGLGVLAVVGWSLYDHWAVDVTPNSPDPAFGDILKDHLKDGLKFSAASAIPILAALRLLESARVSVSRDAPSQDEEFESAFHDLIDSATTKSWWWERRQDVAGWRIFTDRTAQSALSPGQESREWSELTRTQRCSARLRTRVAGAKAWMRKRLAGPRDWIRERVAGSDRWDRILFFVDELDRCAPDDVLATLVGVKTFLEHPRCVFVVAADREVLVEALEQSPGEGKSARQVTPLREDAPYYSTAGAFIDKMFQHQIELPPLRRHALTMFAKEVVSGHSEGIWADLKRDQKLDDVIWTLIPLHVRSPRRIKVLLNNFATTARIASARGIGWRGNPTELAKLTVLRTEFPRFAQDLLAEPRLVRHLQEHDAPDDTASENLKRLYDRYALPSRIAAIPDDLLASAELSSTESASAANGTAAPAAPTPPAPVNTPKVGRTLSEHGEAAEFTSTGAPTQPRKAALARAETNYLRQLDQYLEKAAFVGATGPSRALLYLENVGNREGLSDSNLSDAIDDAPDRAPDITIAAFAGKPDDAVIAIPILAGEVTNQIGPGRQVLTSVICGLAEQLGRHQLDMVSRDAAAAVIPILSSPQWTGAMTAGAIAIANSPGSRTDPGAAIRKFGELVRGTSKTDEATLHIPEVTAALEYLSPEHFSQLSKHLAMAFDKAMFGVEAGLTSLTPGALDRFWDEVAEPVFATIAAQTVQDVANAADGEPVPAIEKATSTSWFVSVVDSLQGRQQKAEPLVVDAFVRGITISSELYAEALEYALGAAPDGPDDPSRGALAVLGIQQGPVTDWSTWARHLGDTTLDPAASSTAIVRVINEADPLDQDSTNAARSLIGRLNAAELPDGGVAPIVAALQAHLTGNPWTTASEALVRLFTEAVVADMRAHTPRIDALYDPVRDADLVAVVQLPEPASALTDLVVRYLHTVPQSGLESMLMQIDATFPTHPTTVHGMRVHMHLKTLVPDQPAFPVAALTGLPSDRFKRQIVNDWLRLDPAVGDLVTLADSGFAFSKSEILLEYVQRLSDKQRGHLWLEFQRTGESSAVVVAVAAPGVPLTVAEPFFLDAVASTNLESRRAAVAALSTLPLGNSTLIGLASEVIYRLVNTGFSGDVKLAGDLALITKDIKGGHKGAAKSAFEQHRAQFPKKQQAQLVVNKMLSNRKGLRGAIDKIRDAF